MSEALDEEVEFDLVSLVAGQSDEEDDHDESEFDGDLPDDADALKQMVVELQERVSKRNKSLNTNKKTTHRMQSEIDALHKKIADIEQRPVPANEGQNREEIQRQAEEWADRVENDPKEAIRYADWKQSQLEQNLGGVLSEFMQKIDSRLNELQTASNPERLKYQKELDILKSNPEFQGVGDDVLLKLAKTLKSANVKPRGATGGQRATTDKSSGPSKEEMTEALKRMGFN